MPKRSLGERFLDLCRVDEEGHWMWQGYVGQTGYGQMRVDGTTRPAHRIAYMLFKDPNLSDDLVCDHLCRRRRCCNPAHLEAVTNVTNQERGETKTALSRKVHREGKCKNGHDLKVWGRIRGNGQLRCLWCHRDNERDRRARRRQEAM